MKNREKLVHQLFIGMVTEIIGVKKTVELLKEANKAFPKESPLVEELRLWNEAIADGYPINGMDSEL